jgi:hypothetical protein
LLSDENTTYKSTFTNGIIVFGLASAVIIGAIFIAVTQEVKEGDAWDWIGIGNASVSMYSAIY